uniref:DNA-directed RNA polymerase subunit beta'' n=1 Tax=Diplophyllum taxifolium TaxID=248355 RepID=A0A7S6VJY3_9MARC|nr:RNA polymerase beta'' subunit [Diplophyllum taxifolium]QOW40215.1 RNA polymerase beta'' subunit [Diplophyllum taxifolium]
MAEPVDLIFYNKVMDRIGIKQLISRLISHFGITYTTHVLDQSKTLGFQYATLGAISLGIDDLLTAPSKSWLIEDAEQYTNLSEKHHNCGNLHAVEKLRQLIETWYATSEYLKQEMNPNFGMTDPSNPVHMMSFSGARGSVSQVHQLVGMRGLMSDPQGQIIDLPIQSNFREGLSLTEYIISCYGARKGVVDTAVRTSDAGYLTRRLVEVVQRIVVRKKDCGSIYGILVNNIQVKKHFFQQKLIGRLLAENIYINNRCFATRNQDIGASLAEKLTNLKLEPIYIRSPLTCKSMVWVCQACYGWSPTNGNLIEIGEAVGIIAGQSIGEPGTQLTLRTFHTGGVFTGDIAEHVRTPFNGIIKFDENFIIPTRTRHGHPAWMCNTNLFLGIRSGDEIHNITIPPKTLLLVQNNQYVESKQVIAEIRAKILPFKEKVRKYIYSNLEGEMFWNTKVRHASEYIHGNIHSIIKTSHIWILSGKSYNKNEKLPISFYENQDKIDSKIFIAKEKNNFSFLDNKKQINICILNSWIFGRNKIIVKSRLAHYLFNNLNNSVDSNIILFGYNVIKKENFFLLREKNATLFTLQLQKNGILRNNDVLASLNPPEYKLGKSGIIKYGSIKVGSINGNNSDERKTKFYQPKYRIIKGGNFFFISEKVYLSTKNLSSLLINNNKFVQAGTLITSSLASDVSGLVKIKKGVNNSYEVKILPGTIYYPDRKYEISKQISILIPPDKKIFNEFRCNNWTYLQWIMPFKQKPFAFIRPATEYSVVDEYNKTNLLNLLRRHITFKIKTISYLFHEDGEQIRILDKKNIQLLRTCLIVQWREKYFLEKARICFLRIKTKNTFRNFLQISLINSFRVLNRNKLKKKLNVQSVLKRKNYDIFLSLSNKELVSKYEGIIRIIFTKNDESKSFIVLSPFDLVGKSKIKKLTKLSVEQNINNIFSNKFFNFYEYRKNIDYSGQLGDTEVGKDNSKKNYLRIMSVDNLGFIGNFQNIKNYLKCFYWNTDMKLIMNNSPITQKHENKCQNPNWYFIDEYQKFHKFIFRINTNQSLFKWCLSFSPPLEREILQKFNLGCFFFDNFRILKYSENYPSGQIIGIHKNYFVIRLAKPYLATRGAIIHNNYGEFVNEGDTLITLIYERLKSGDIIQGLPKVEQLLEARPVNLVSINLENSFEDWNNDMKKFIGTFWGFFLSTKVSIEQGQIILVDQIQKVYQSQGVHVSNKHIEIIVRQMTSKVRTLEDGMINIFLPGELIESSRARRMNRILEEAIPYEPILLGITKASLNTQSFISEASFQETTRVLAKAALKGRIDWLKGLKENVILGGIIPAGTGSQEVIWQINLEEKKEVFFGKKNISFNNKMKNIFLYQNEFTIVPPIATIHNLLKGSIFENNIDVLSI